MCLPTPCNGWCVDMAVASLKSPRRTRAKTPSRFALLSHIDQNLMVMLLLLLGVGLVMVASSSVAVGQRIMGDPLHYTERQLMYLAIGTAMGAVAFCISTERWRAWGPMLIVGCVIGLTLVLIPGVGVTVNGARRWLNLLVVKFQVAEIVKLSTVVYLAGYIVRHKEKVLTTFGGFLRPLFLLAMLSALLLFQPDFGSSVVIMLTAMGLLFLAGVQLAQFSLISFCLAALATMAVLLSSYRMARLSSFIDPWDDPFNTDFQLSHSLIAIGRGAWHGQGLGNSVQKLEYLPEPHTDFVFAVFAEEFGLIGVALLLILFACFVYRGFYVSRLAERAGLEFGALVAAGISLWIAVQTLINLGVNMGVLPTKGLTLPLISSGGSSLMVSCISVAVLLRISAEANQALQKPHQRRRRA